MWYTDLIFLKTASTLHNDLWRNYKVFPKNSSPQFYLITFMLVLLAFMFISGLTDLSPLKDLYLTPTINILPSPISSLLWTCVIIILNCHDIKWGFLVYNSQFIFLILLLNELMQSNAFHMNSWFIFPSFN